MARQVSSSTPAPCGSRCVAAIVDSFLNFIPCYGCWKDGIRDGQSFGKGLMGLRVIKVHSDSGATCSDSCLRNCTNAICPIGYCLIFVSDKNQHLGDNIAGTMVIEDK
jgi:uncharacterized RDD family membrane protein YckC